MPYEEISHTADIALRVWGTTLEQLFTAAAQGMFWLAGAQATSSPIETKVVALNAPDVETLLVAWLDELLWLTEQGWQPTGYSFDDLQTTALVANVQGEALLAIKSHIKAVTFTELNVRQTARGFETNIVFDV